MSEQKPITHTDIRELKKLFSGKVRDIYEVKSDQWLIVTTDRISAFDVVFNEGVPEKGKILNGISNKWFSLIGSSGLGLKNHLLSVTPEKELSFLNNYPGVAERSVIVKKMNRLAVECVVRGYLFGSVYEEYKTAGTAGGNKLPKGLGLAEVLPEPIFTPTTKAEAGHDEGIDHETFFKLAGEDLGKEILRKSIEIYILARDKMATKGIILADTKFEFGLDDQGGLVLVDEVLTPDSSRYWEKESYRIGESPKSYDKQFVRDYLNDIKWNKTPPPPALPADIIAKTAGKYRQIYDIIQSI